MTSLSPKNIGVECHRALRFDVSLEDVRLDWLMKEFRLLVNKSIRIALAHDLRSRARLTKVAYRPLSQEHRIYKQYIPSAFEAALGVLKAHRRRLRKGRRSSVPYMRRLMLKAENQSYWLDRETGRLRIPIRGTEGFSSICLCLSGIVRSCRTPRGPSAR